MMIQIYTVKQGRKSASISSIYYIICTMVTMILDSVVGRYTIKDGQSITCMYWSSFLKCSAMNSTASVALDASGDKISESELSLSLLSALAFRLILQLGWCRSASSIASILCLDGVAELGGAGAGRSDGDVWCGCGGPLIPGISIIHLSRVFFGRFMNMHAGR